MARRWFESFSQIKDCDLNDSVNYYGEPLIKEVNDTPSIQWGRRADDLRIPSLVLANDVIMLVSWCHDLQLSD